MVQLMRYPLPILNIGMEIKMRFVYYTKYKCYKDLKQNKKKKKNNNNNNNNSIHSMELYY